MDIFVKFLFVTAVLLSDGVKGQDEEEPPGDDTGSATVMEVGRDFGQYRRTLPCNFNNKCRWSPTPTPYESDDSDESGEIETTTPITCAENQTSADRGYDCASCYNLSGACSLTTETKCYCNVGYVRDASDNCILPEDCRSSCRQNETFASTGYDCHNCDNYDSLVCPVLRESKCYCNPGFVRNDTGFCIEPTDCPVYGDGQCKRNQTYSTMGYDCQTCANYQFNTACSLTQVAKCYCNPGYVREINSDRCILGSDCNKLEGTFCSENQTYSNFGFDCATCATRRYATCRAENENKCFCKVGYVKNNTNSCILVSDCLNNLTATNERCKNPAQIGCPGGCVKTCSNRNYYIYTNCPPACRECECPVGQVRHDATGNCVTIDQCLQYTYSFPFYATSYGNYRG